MKWALSRLSEDEGDWEGMYAVRHGGRPVRDLMRQPKLGKDVNDDFFEKAFPVLFPYGEGGLERERPTKVDSTTLVRRALMYHDRRFRKHNTFPFVVFGIQQKLQVLNSAQLQLRKSNYDRDFQIISNITRKQLQDASEEESQKKSISDPGIRLLRKYVHASAANVQGSNASRTKLRSQIWSTAVIHGPPFLWVTINPSDVHHPIAQVFAGESIDLDNFCAVEGPDSDQRACTIAADPYAAAKFYHFLIQTILECLFGITVTKYQIISSMGIMGEVAAYFGLHE
ncbi:hypothetical protein F5880DRAFT_1490155, partial [Lentinula raphanica]